MLNTIFQTRTQHKTHFMSVALLFGYTFLHIKLTGVFVDVDLNTLIALKARLPFGQRLLVPQLAHALQTMLPLSTAEIFCLLEWGFISLFFFALKALLETNFDKKMATLLSWMFILLLPLTSVVNYRFTTGYEATFFYPYDSASLFFMALGFLWCLEKRWCLYTAWVFLATLNRESSILLVFLIPALHWRTGTRWLRPFANALGTFALARGLVLYWVRNLAGPLAEWCHHNNHQITHFEINLSWLLDKQCLFLFMFCFAGLPLFWFTFYDYIPLRFRPIRYLAFAYFLGLLMVGNFPEVRIFSEILVLLYLPVCLGVRHWLLETPQTPIELKFSLWNRANRYALLIFSSLLVFFYFPLTPWVHWLTHLVTHCS